MAEFTKGELIAMQKNLGLGHKGDILLTTQERVDNNQEAIAKDIIDIEHTKELVRRWNEYPDLKQQRDDLLAACKGMLECMPAYYSSYAGVIKKAKAAIKKAQ